MKPRYQVSRAAVELIKKFEGYRRKAARLADGRWTIGYGHTLTAREGAEVSEQDAEALLLYDLIAVAHGVNEGVYAPLTQNQFDALSAFAFNIGIESFRRSSVLRRLNEGQHLQAACAMDLWRKAEFEGEPIVIDALVRRRSAEKALFLTPPGGWVPAPSPILRPSVDMDASGAVPLQTPTVLEARMDGPLAVVHRVETPAAAPQAEPLSPAQAAAATVASRLSTIFPDAPVPEPELTPQPAVQPAPQAQPAPEPAPTPVADPVSQPAPVTEPPSAEQVQRPPLPPPTWPTPSGAERAFVLTSPQEQDFDAHAAEPAHEASAAVHDAEPSLFDPRAQPANDQFTQPSPPAEARPRILIDDTLEYEGSFDAITPEQPRFSLLPFILLGVLGVIVFAWGMFWSVSVKDTGQGPSVAAMVGWLACLAGVGFFITAAYLILGKLGRVEPRHDAAERDFDAE